MSRRALVVLGAAVATILWAVATAPAGDPAYHFAERRAASLVDAGLLLATGIVLLRAAAVRRRRGGTSLPYELAGWGFVYLAFDEHFQYHERIGRLAERIAPEEAFAWVNHLDDLVVLGYGIAALAVLAAFRAALVPTAAARRTVAVAVALLFLMVGIDGFAPDTPPYRAVEESAKLLASATFLLWALAASDAPDEGRG